MPTFNGHLFAEKKRNPPHLSATPSGTATIYVDSVELEADVIAVLEPVRVRGSRRTLLPASGREALATGSGDGIRYFIESTLTGSAVKLRLMLSGHVSADTVLEFQACTTPAAITQADIHNGSPNYADPGVPLPILGGFVESVFLPWPRTCFSPSPASRTTTSPRCATRTRRSSSASRRRVPSPCWSRCARRGRSPRGLCRGGEEEKGACYLQFVTGFSAAWRLLVMACSAEGH